MREKLKERELKRGTYTATFVRFGSKSGYKGYPVKTVLFRDVADSAAGVVVTDHLWFTCGKQFTALDLLPGDVVSFAARSKAYTKGYRGRRDDDDLPAVETDYRLSNPTNVMKLRPNEKPLVVGHHTRQADGRQISLF